jgi:hypothetical protein
VGDDHSYPYLGIVGLGGVLRDDSVDQLVEDFSSEEVMLVVLYEVHPSYWVLELGVADVLPV